MRPVDVSAHNLVTELLVDCSTARHPDARELARVLNKLHVRTLIDAHDTVATQVIEALAQHATTPTTIHTSSSDNNAPAAARRLSTSNTSAPLLPDTDNNDPSSPTSTITMPSETIKMVGLRRKVDEPLGLTVELDEHNQLQVARILAGGMIDRQGLLHPGDVILEVNGVPVATPEQLQDQISLAKENLTLKIGPSVDEEMKSARLTISGGQVKNGRNLDSGKKLTVSFLFVFCLTLV